jgi:Outer membrane protein beta-barrel domain
MKRILMSGLAIAFIGMAQAQTSGTTFGLKAGVNFQNLTGKDVNGDKLDNKLKTGLSLGANAQIPIATDFYIQPGVEFNQKGAKSNDGNDKASLSYIDVPVSLVYKPALGSGRLILGFGPYIGFGIGGKVESGGNSADVKFKNDVTISDFNSGDVFFKRMDAGANFFAGYEMSNKLSLQLNTQLGLAKINPSYEGIPDDRSSVKNTGFGLSLGYRL